MRRLFIALFLLIIAAPIHAQDLPTLTDALTGFCTVEAHGLDIAEPCINYAECIGDACWEDMIAGYLNSCMNMTCTEFVVMFSNATEACVDLFYFSDEPDIIDGDLCTLILDGYLAHIDGNYEAAAISLEQAYAIYPHWAVAANAAIAYKAMNNVESALEAFDRSVNLQFQNPFAYYPRALFYLALEERDLARRDYDYAVKMISHRPQVQAALPILIQQEPDFESYDWDVYSIFTVSDGPGGTYLYDGTRHDPTVGQIAFIDDGETLAITSISEFEAWNPGMEGLIPDTIYMPKVAPGTYELNMYHQPPLNGLSSKGGIMRLSFEGARAYIFETFDLFEGYAEQHRLLQIPVLADPFTPLDARRCEDFPVSIMRRGEIGVNTSVGPMYLRESPAMTPFEEAIRADIRRVILLDGPVCNEGVVWWYVQANETGETGWVTESYTYRYEDGTLETGTYNMLPLAFVTALDDGSYGPWFNFYNMTPNQFYDLALR